MKKNVRYKYHTLIKNIDDKLLNERPKMKHAYTVPVNLTEELKQVLLDEYASSWEKIEFVNNTIYFHTVHIDDQKVLTHKEIDASLNKKGWKFEFTQARLATWRTSRKRGAS